MTDTLQISVNPPTPPAPPALSLRAGWPILAALILATAVVTVDNTVLNVALPSISRSLHAGESQLQWIANAYSLLFGGLLLTAGNLADRLGRKRVLMAGLTAFGLASALVVLVSTGPQLIVVRALIGAAAAFVMPSTLALLMRVFAGPARTAAMTIWSTVSMLGFVGGPLLGGVILEHFSWPAVFLVNVPIAACALLVTWRCVTGSAGSAGSAELNQPAARPDPLGTVLSVGALGSLVYTLISGPQSGWLSARVVGSALVCLAVSAAFGAWELHTESPLLPLHFLRRVSFAGPAFAESTLMFSIAGLLFVVTQQFQFVDGYSPLQAGLRSAPAALGALLTGVPGVWVATRFGAHVCAFVGFLLGAVGLAAGAFLIADSYWHFVVPLVIFGAGLRMAMTPVAMAVVDALPHERAGMGSALNDTFQEVGGALGIAVLGSVLNSVLRSHTADGIAAGPAFESGAQAAFLVGAAVMVVAAVVALTTVPAGKIAA